MTQPFMAAIIGFQTPSSSEGRKGPRVAAEGIALMVAGVVVGAHLLEVGARAEGAVAGAGEDGGPGIVIVSEPRPRPRSTSGTSHC